MKVKNNKVVYTAIFGSRGSLIEPIFVPKNWDFICFTDRTDFVSDIWQIRNATIEYDDPTRNARMYKVLSHKYLSSYDISLWIDGNLSLLNSPDELIEKYLRQSNLAVFNHKYNKDSIDCIYKEAENLFRLYSIGRYKDDPIIIQRQIDKYRNEGYPKDNGLAVTQVLLRRHNKNDVIEMMNFWWWEIKNNSKRDQLSFNYAAWKTGFNFTYLPGDSRNNKWFKYFPHQKWSLIRKVTFHINYLLKFFR